MHWCGNKKGVVSSRSRRLHLGSGADPVGCRHSWYAGIACPERAATAVAATAGFARSLLDWGSAGAKAISPTFGSFAPALPPPIAAQGPSIKSTHAHAWPTSSDAESAEMCSAAHTEWTQQTEEAPKKCNVTRIEPRQHKNSTSKTPSKHDRHNQGTYDQWQTIHLIRTSPRRNRVTRTGSCIVRNLGWHQSETFEGRDHLSKENVLDTESERIRGAPLAPRQWG